MPVVTVEPEKLSAIHGNSFCMHDISFLFKRMLECDDTTVIEDIFPQPQEFPDHRIVLLCLLQIHPKRPAESIRDANRRSGGAAG